MVRPLKQILLPRAHGIPLKKLNQNQQQNLLNEQPENFEQQQNLQSQQQQFKQQSTHSPNVIRDSQNRPLILSPQHCKMVNFWILFLKVYILSKYYF